VQQIKGSVLKSRLAYIEEHFGADGKARVLQALGPDDQRALRMVLTASWYPFDVGKRLDQAIVDVLGGGDGQLFERLGEASALQNLSTIHKGFLTQGDAHAFLAKAPVIYDLYYETGRRMYERTGEREGMLTTYDADTFSAPDCATIRGWHRKALELCGVQGVRIVEEECRASGGIVCRYRLTWN
jgi:hypothetical protein